MMPCGVTLRDNIRILKFIALLAMCLLKTDREGHQPMLPRLGKQPDDQAGIHTAAQQRADRHVGHKTPLHRLSE